MAEEILSKDLPALAVVSASPIAAVAEINRLLKDYIVMSYHWAVVEKKIVLSALLVSKTEMRKMMLANTQMPNMRQ